MSKARTQRPATGRGHILRSALRTIVLLRRGRWTAPELAAELGCNRRTIYRLLNSLRDAGIRVETHHEGDAPSGVVVHYRISATAVREALRL